MRVTTLFFCVIVFILSSCNKEDELIFDSNNLLLGNWVIEKSEYKELTFKRVNELEENNYGVSFKPKNVFIQRTTGWCGTPPVSYFDTPGTYVVNNKLISVTTDHYTGNFKWYIVFLDESTLTVRIETDEE